MYKYSGVIFRWDQDTRDKQVAECSSSSKRNLCYALVEQIVCDWR